MPSLNQALQDIVFALQGRATLESNWLAVQVDRLYLDAWDKCFKGTKANPNAFRGITVRVQDLIFAYLDSMYKETWYRGWVKIIEAMPRDLVFAISLSPKFKEADEDPEEPRDDQAPDLNPTAPGRDREPEIARSIPREPPARFSFAKALYTPITQKEITKLNLESEWKRFLEKSGNETKIIQQTVKGIVEGKHNREIARAIQKTVQLDKTTATRIARTEAHRINTAAQEASIRDSLGKSVGAWKYIATLDNRTRPAHAARDGKVYQDDEERPLLPDGPNCRCTYAPVTKSFTDLGVPELEGLFGPATRASMDGAVPPTENYSSWFGKQSGQSQREIIGAKRFDSLPKRNGKVQWSDYVRAPNSPAKTKPEATVKGNRSNPKNIK